MLSVIFPLYQFLFVSYYIDIEKLLDYTIYQI